jgi:hypothetical protein
MKTFALKGVQLSFIQDVVRWISYAFNCKRFRNTRLILTYETPLSSFFLNTLSFKDLCHLAASICLTQ